MVELDEGIRTRLESIAERVFPGQTIEDVSPHTDVRYTVINVAREGEKPVMVRLEEERKPGYFTTGVDIRDLGSSILEQRPVLGDFLPKLLDSGEIDEGPYLVLSHMKGTPLRERREHIPIEKGKEIMHSLGELVGRLHAHTSYNHVGHFNGTNHAPSDWGVFMRNILLGHLDAPYVNEVFTPEEQERILSYSTAMAGHQFDFKPILATHDWHDGQILVTDDYAVSGIVPAVHDHKGPGQLAQVSIRETFYDAPWKGETDPEGLEDAFNQGYSSVTGQEFPNDPDVERLLWLNQFLYAGPSKRGKKSAFDGARIRDGFAEIYANKVMQIVAGEDPDTTKFFELRRNEQTGEDVGYILPEYREIVEERKSLVGVE